MTQVHRKIAHYNLDVIIAIGYRVQSPVATRFRRWATARLHEFIQKGFALDDERLKNGRNRYFKELLQRIRDIRSSERNFYQQVTDIYATSVDYDPRKKITKDFFASVQNKLHYAVHEHTAAELVYERVDSEKPFVGMTNYKGDYITEDDVKIARNYLSEKEILKLNRLSTAFLDFAETQAENHIVMNMADWQQQLEKFLSVYNFDILQNAGTVSAEDAKQKAFAEYDKFKLVQDRDYLSDFDKEIKKLSETATQN